MCTCASTISMMFPSSRVPIPAGMLRDIEHLRTVSRARAVEGGYIVVEVRAWAWRCVISTYRSRNRLILARISLASAKRSGDVSGRDVARPEIVGVRAAQRSTWAVRRLSLDRAFTAIAMLPTFVVMLCIFGIPLLFSLYLSFTGWALDQALLGGRFVGLANYADLLTDPAFVGSLGITFGYTAATVAAQIMLGLVIALLLNIDLPYMRVLRTALVVPMMITPIVGALCWKLLLEPSLGFINYLISQKIVWLGMPATALMSVLGV